MKQYLKREIEYLKWNKHLAFIRDQTGELLEHKRGVGGKCFSSLSQLEPGVHANKSHTRHGWIYKMLCQTFHAACVCVCVCVCVKKEDMFVCVGTRGK